MAIKEPYLGWRIQRLKRKGGVYRVLIARRAGQKAKSLGLGFCSEEAAERYLLAMTWLAEGWYVYHHGNAIVEGSALAAFRSENYTAKPRQAGADPFAVTGEVVHVPLLPESTPEVQERLRKPDDLALQAPHRIGSGQGWRVMTLNPLWLVEHGRKRGGARDEVLRFLFALGEWVEAHGLHEQDAAREPVAIPERIIGGLPIPNVYSTMALEDYVERVWAVERFGGPKRGESHEEWKKRWQGTKEGRLWKTYLLPGTLARVPIGTLDKRLFNRFIKNFRLQSGGVPSGNTRRLVKAAYQAMLTWADEQGHIEEAHGYYRLKGTTKRVMPKPDPLRYDQIQAIIDAATNDMHRALFAFAWELGPRPTEVSRLNWEDIDWSQTRQDPWGKVKLKGTKTDASKATLPMGPLSKTYLFIWFRAAGRPESGPVFVWRGKRITNFRTALKNAAVKAGIEGRVFRYLLRHSFATHQARRGMSDGDVAKLMRHTSPRMSRTTYDHSGPAEGMDVKAVFSLALGASVEGGEE